jgi:hypothetical protein
MMGILHQSKGKGNAAARTLGGTISASRLAKQPEDSAANEQIHDISRRPQFSGLSGELGVASSQFPIQAKLTIGQPNDRYEQEADRVASQVVQQINAPTSVQSPQGQSVQRTEALEEEKIQAKPENTSLQRMEVIAGGEATPDLDTAINRARAGGQPLDAGLQQSMGQAMGADFSGVKVHRDAQANLLNQLIQAKAFTTGEDVFFRQGAYEPGSRGGQELIAHELTHVVQQNRGAVKVANAEVETVLKTGEANDEVRRVLDPDLVATYKADLGLKNLSLVEVTEHESAEKDFGKYDPNRVEGLTETHKAMNAYTACYGKEKGDEAMNEHKQEKEQYTGRRLVMEMLGGGGYLEACKLVVTCEDGPRAPLTGPWHPDVIKEADKEVEERTLLHEMGHARQHEQHGATSATADLTILEYHNIIMNENRHGETGAGGARTAPRLQYTAGLGKNENPRKGEAHKGLLAVAVDAEKQGGVAGEMNRELMTEIITELRPPRYSEDEVEKITRNLVHEYYKPKKN